MRNTRDLEQASRELELASANAPERSELMRPAAQQARLSGLVLDAGAVDFDGHLKQHDQYPLIATGVDVFQINLGRICNQTCAHCHVDAGPTRKEVMSRETAELCMKVLATTDIPTVDITGGAPELCPEFEYIVRESRRLGRHVLDRCNLTILMTKPYSHLPEFFAEYEVEVVCSLPHYRGLSTDKQRGDGVFDLSIAALRKLNEVGYGRDPKLKLVLVTNPVGAFLPTGQDSLEGEWKREMKRLHDIDFNELFSITNMPISRYLEWLEEKGNLDSYMEQLVGGFNPVAATGVMCRNTLSVGWQGELYDCDFNQMLDLEVGFGAPRHLSEFDLTSLASRQIVTGPHCYGCTAGPGSSCGGQVAE